LSLPWASSSAAGLRTESQNHAEIIIFEGIGGVKERFEQKGQTLHMVLTVGLVATHPLPLPL
jgi:hypothetical protein